MKSTQEEKKELLKELDGKTLTCKELNNAGINNYYLKVFIDSKLIERIKRGVYKVNLKKKENKYKINQMFKLFTAFKYRVRENNYDKAYEALMKIIKLDVGHDYDNDMYIYFILLKELLDDSYDFSILDDLYVFSEENMENYYIEPILFRESIMVGNFYEAKLHLDRFSEEEKIYAGQNNISTILFNIMLEDVIIKLEESNYNSQVRDNIYKENYSKLIKALNNHNYNDASKYIDICIFYSKSRNNSLNLKKMRILINDLISIIEGETIDHIKVNYNKAKNCYYKLDWAIYDKDYNNALVFVEEILKNDTRQYFKLLKDLLQKIVKIQNKENISPMSSETAYQAFIDEYNHGEYEKALGYLEICKIRNSNKEFMTNYHRLFDLLDFLVSMKNNKCGFYSLNINYDNCKSDEEILYKALDNKDFKIALKTIDKVTHDNHKEILTLFKRMLQEMNEFDKTYITEDNKQEKEVILDDDMIIGLVYSFNYDKLYILLSKKRIVNGLNRLEMTVFRLLKIYYKIKYDQYIANYHNYEIGNYDALKRMFEAIRFEDVNEAYEMANKALSFIRDPKEVEIYQIILKDIINLINIKEEDKRTEEEKNKIDKLILLTLKDKKYLDNSEITDIELLLDTRYNYSNNKLTNIWSNILEFISLANTTNLDKNYFGSINDCEDFKDINILPVKNRLMIYLNNGDYLNARNIIKNLEKYNRYNMFSEYERDILKRLLDLLYTSLDKVYTYEPIFVTEDENLKIIKKYIENNDFHGVYKYIIDNKLNNEYLEKIFLYIFEGMCLTLIEQYDMKKAFLEAIKNDKMDIARIEMLNYKEALDKTSLGNIESMQETYNFMVKTLKK